ncbi:carbon-nitrogen hydrolase family protein [Kaarinaea lacus]
MAKKLITRRQALKTIAATILTGAFGMRAQASIKDASSGLTPVRLKVAAIQMSPTLADAESNMIQAEQLIKEAIRKGAQWIMLPEMYTTAAGFHPDMLQAIQPIDGKPLLLLKELSRKANVVIGGSFLAQHDAGVFNTFVLVFPDGTVEKHNKDLPTYWENCYYKKGNDDGVLTTSIGPVGSVLCWEFIRSNTAKRLLNNVRMVVGGSCWWTLPDEADADSPLRKDNLKMLKDAPVRMAKMLGVPVVHGSHAGRFEGFFSPDLADVSYNSEYLGEAMIVDARGQVLASLSKDKKAGVITSEIELGQKPTPSESIPGSFWTPKEMPKEWKESFDRWLDKGADYYANVTAPYLETGVENEYVPIYMR